MGNRGIVEEELKGEECGREGECSQLREGGTVKARRRKRGKGRKWGN